MSRVREGSRGRDRWREQLVDDFVNQFDDAQCSWGKVVAPVGVVVSDLGQRFLDRSQ